MLDIQQKRKIRNIAYNRITLILLFLFVLLSVHSTFIVYKKKNLSENMKETAMKRYQDLKVRDSELNMKIDRLSTDSGIEEEIRTKFNVSKDRENMVVVVDNKDDSIATTTILNTGFWSRIKNLLGI